MPLLLLWHPGVHVNVDSATIYLDLQPSSTEQVTFDDSATVYLDLQPGYIFVQVDFLLEIISATSRWQIDLPLARWTMLEPVARVHILDVFLRWVILETRRLIWKR